MYSTLRANLTGHTLTQVQGWVFSYVIDKLKALVVSYSR